MKLKLLLLLIINFYSYFSWAGCSPYIGLASINEISRDQQKKNKSTDFIEFKLLDDSILPAVYNGWSYQICHQLLLPSCISTQSLSTVSVNSPYLVMAGNPVPSAYTRWHYGSSIYGFDLALRDANGDLIDYVSSNGITTQEESCSFLFDTSVTADSSTRRIRRQADGVGDWNVPSGNSQPETEGNTNDTPAPTGSPDVYFVADVTVDQLQTATFTLELSASYTSDVTLQYYTANSSALAGTHYVNNTGTLTIPAGSTEGFINISTLLSNENDDKDFFVVLQSATNATITDQIAIGTIRAAVIPPVAYYAMEDNGWSGSIGEVTDGSGNNLNGRAISYSSGYPTNVNVSPAIPGDPGSCFYGEFSQTNGYLQIDDNNLLDLSTALTVTAWIYPTSFPSSALYTIVSKDENYEFHLNSSGEINWWWGGGAQELTTSSSGIYLNQWHHVAITYVSGQQKIYVDGVERATQTTVGNLTLNSDPLLIGTDLDFNSRHFPGRIDEVNVYDQALTEDQVNAVMIDTHPCITISLDHFSISHSERGINCQPEAITITAIDSSGAADTSYTGTINITTSTNNGDWTLGTGAGSFSAAGLDLGTASYGFNSSDNGTVILNLSDTHVETLSINVTDGSISETTNNAVAADDPNLSFAKSGFVFLYDDGSTPTTIFPQQLSNKPVDQALLRAITTDTATGVCTGLFSGNVDVDFALQCTDPASCSSAVNTSMLINSVIIAEETLPADPLNYTLGVTLNFGADSTAILPSLTYQDAGQIKLHARYDQAGDNIIGESNNVVFKPAGLCVETQAAASDCSAPITDCSGYVAAGDAFNLTVSARAWQADGDLDFCAGNTLTPGFNLTDVTLESALSTGSPGNEDGVLGITTIDLVNGVWSTTAQSISEVGVFNITATPADNTYFTETANGGISADIGRFYPANFVMTSNIISAACTDAIPATKDFSYMGQPAGVVLGYTLTAYNGALIPQITKNYSTVALPGTDYVKSIQQFVAENLNDGNDYGGRISGLPSSTWVDGVASFVGSGIFERLPTLTADGPYSSLAVGLKFSDSDGGRLTGDDMNAATADDCNVALNCDAKQIGIADIRFGQMKLSNVFGPETMALVMDVTTEYYAGASAGFITNTDDSCSVLSILESPPAVVPPYIDIGSYSGSLSSLSASGFTAISSGEGSFTFPAVGLGNQGSALVTYFTNSWLLAEDEDVDMEFNNNPKATITYGQFRGNDRIIYWRENVR